MDSQDDANAEIGSGPILPILNSKFY